MNESETDTVVVQRIRTFADDVRRVTERGDMRFRNHQESAPRPAFVRNASTKAPATAVLKGAVSASVAPAKPPAAKTDTPPPSTNPSPTLGRPSSYVPKPSYPADNQKPFDIRQESGSVPYEGTIVKNARRKRWSFTDAIGKALTAWISEQKNTIARIMDRKDPEPNVPPPQTRIGVIQAAREKSAIAEPEDLHVMVETLRTLAHDSEQVTGKPYTLLRKPLPDELTPRWSYVTEDPSLAAIQHTPGIRSQQQSGTLHVTNLTPSRETRLPIKQARRIIRPTPLPSPAPTPAVPLPPAKNLAKDVAPQIPQSLSEHAFISMQEHRKTPARPVPMPYGVADIAPLAARAPKTENEVPPPATPVVSTLPATDQNTVDAHRAAVERLRAIRPPHAEKSTPPELQPTTPPRNIAREQPSFAIPRAAHFRTYRGDAIRDVEKHQRSIPNIAAAEAIRRTAQAASATPRAPATVSARPFVIAGILMIVVVVLGGFGFFWYAKHGAREDTAAVTIPTFMTIDAQTAAPFSTNRSALLETLDTAVRASRAGVTQIYPAYTEDRNEATRDRGVATAEFMHVLDPRAPGSFIRNLSNEMMFGAWNGADPFFIFKTEQFDTAFAGMLDWEPYISADLTPLFGSPVERTRDLTLRTADQTRDAYFVDGTVRGMDARILYDDTGTERLLYAFLDKNTMVITTSSAALSELLARLQR